MHDHLIDDASGVTEHRSSGRKRSVAVLLAAVVAMVTMVAGAGAASATAPLPLANPTGITSVNPNDNIGADLTVTWTAPVPPDNTTGFEIQVYDLGTVATPTAASLTEEIFPAISQLKLNTTNNTYSYNVTGLTNPHVYSFQVLSENAEGATNPALPVATASTGVVAPPAFSAPVVPVTPFNYATADAAIKQDYEDFLGRQPSFSELVLWETYLAQHQEHCTFNLGGATGPYPAGTLSPANYALYCPNYGGEYDLITFLRYGGTVDNGGTATIDGVGAQFEQVNTYAGVANPVIRLYFAFFNRIPDYTGLKTWVNKERTGTSIDAIASAFAKSHEFITKYGKTLSDGDFVTLVYFNVLGRAPDFGGQNYWLNQLAQGESRGAVMNAFAQSNENIVNLVTPDVIVGTYAALLYRVPSSTELFAERAEIQSNAGPSPSAAALTAAYQVFQGKIRDSVEYAKRTIQATPWNPIKAAS